MHIGSNVEILKKIGWITNFTSDVEQKWSIIRLGEHLPSWVFSDNLFWNLSNKAKNIWMWNTAFDLSIRTINFRVRIHTLSGFTNVIFWEQTAKTCNVFSSKKDSFSAKYSKWNQHLREFVRYLDIFSFSLLIHLPKNTPRKVFKPNSLFDSNGGSAVTFRLFDPFRSSSLNL